MNNCLTNWDFSNFQPTRFNRKLRKFIENPPSLIPYNSHHLLNIILQSAEKLRSVEVKGGKYYKYAKFIKTYHKLYTFRKDPLKQKTCCNAYPEICGGHCCGYKRLVECGCERVRRSAIRIDNCWNDCCCIFVLIHSKKFILTWMYKEKIKE
jgi:hypothetical protein